jgi:hypothetical protein
MNRLEYYNRQKDSWDENEIQSLKSEYEKEMTISEIADIHHRTPGSISYKLKNMKLIIHNTQSRGYNEYRTSELYKEIVEKGKIMDAEKKEKMKIKDAEKKDKMKVKDESKVKDEIKVFYTSEITELKNEISSLKIDVKEMLRLIHKLYDFENQ